MSRSGALACLFVAAALASAGCSSKTSAPAPGVVLRQPSAVAAFSGVTLKSASIRAYLAIANAGRNDLSIIDGIDDTAVPAPIQLRTLEIPVPNRPALLVSASLGDEDADPSNTDLLVAVSAGDSKLQLIGTWTAANEVVAADDADPDAHADVLALLALPSPPGTARLAAALADRRLAVVEYRRAAGGAIELAGAPAVHGLPFQALALATVPGDPAHAYAASLEPVAPGILGVGEIDVSAPPLPDGDWATRALDARAPTRLVAAARLRERRPDAAQTDPAAFGCDAAGSCPAGAQPVVTRVYAVLDEASCGPAKRIDCGVVALDPSIAVVPGVTDSIPDDWDGAMPYRASIRLRARPLAIAAAAPPAVPPSQEAADAIYGGGEFMRLYAGDPAVPATPRAEATTGVGAVANSDGFTVFLDLGRSLTATSQSPLSSTKGVAALPAFANNLRLWIPDPSSDTGFAKTEADAAKLVTVTPGWTPDETWTVTVQGKLPALDTRNAEVGDAGGGPLWLAIQRAVPESSRFTEVARLWDPALGVHVGDIVVVKARSVTALEGGTPTCTGTTPPGTPSTADPTQIVKEFEVRVAALLPPDAARPGGAVQLAPLVAPPAPNPDPQEWRDCVDALARAVSGAATRTVNLAEVTLRASGLLLEGGTLGYAGRPALGQEYVLQYPTNATPPDPDEDQLAASCPLVDWGDGAAPACPACDRAVCEKALLARKVRRYVYLAEDCAGDDQACIDRWTRPDGSHLVFPLARGPALAFTVDVQPNPAASPPPAAVATRDMAVRIATASVLNQAVRPLAPSPVQASGMISFDRTRFGHEPYGYRFIVPYATDSVMDTSPSVSPADVHIIR